MIGSIYEKLKSKMIPSDEWFLNNAYNQIIIDNNNKINDLILQKEKAKNEIVKNEIVKNEIVEKELSFYLRTLQHEIDLWVKVNEEIKCFQKELVDYIERKCE